MKKFLSILLALAVGFTFTFGSAMSAFATTATPDQVKYYQAAGQYMKDEASKNLDAVYSAITDAAPTDNYISAAAWETVKADLKAFVLADIDKATQAAIDTNTATLTGYAAKDYSTIFASEYFYNYDRLKARLLDDSEEVGAIADADTAVNAKVYAAQAQFKTNFDKYVSNYDKVDLTAYSKTTPETGDTYYTQAVKAIAKDKEILKDYYFDAAGDVKLYNMADITWSDTFVKEIISKQRVASGLSAEFTGLTELFWDAAGTISKDQFVVTGIKTIKGEESEATLDAAKTAALKAQIAKNMAEYLATTGAKKNLADDYTTLYNCLAENMPKDAGLNTQVYDGFTIAGMNSITNITDAVDAVADLKAFAEKYAAEKDAAGNLVRDAKDVQDIVKKAELDIYAKAVGLTPAAGYKYDTVAKAEAAIKALSVKGDAAKLAFDKEVKKAALAEALDDIVNADPAQYYDLELAKVKAAYEAATAKVDAATKADWTEIDAELAKEISKINKTDAVDALFTKGAMKAELDKQVNALNALVAYKNSGLKAYDNNHVEVTNAAKVLTDYYIKNNARTAEEMKALTGVVDAVAATLPTVGSLDAAKKAAEAAIKALPAKIASTDTDAVKNAYDLAEAYKEMADVAYANGGDVANRGTLTNAVTGLQTALSYDINKAYAQADKKDKAALKAVAEMYENAKETLEALGSNLRMADPTVNDLAKIREAEKAAVINAIKNLPLNITEADRAKVEAARALYDAYVADWTNAEKNIYAAGDITNFSDLSLAEAALATLVKVADDDVKAYLNTLKVTVKSAKTAKKNVKVTAKVAVKATGEAADFTKFTDAGYTFKYKFYRSTKTTVKYTVKKAKDTATWTNTAGKKGTKYYYKVKVFAYDKDGNFVGQTYQSQCNYTSKVFGK